MRGRKPDQFRLKPKDEIILRELRRDGRTPLMVARHAQILLNRANDEERVVHLGEKVELGRTAIWWVCERYRQVGLEAGRYDVLRSGRPRAFPPGQRFATCRRVSMSCSHPSMPLGSIRPSLCWKPSPNTTCCAQAGVVVS